MDNAVILTKLNEIFKDVLEDDSIVVAEDTTASDIDNWDSLSHITLIAAVEEEFDIKFAMKDVIGMKNVGEMVEIIEREA